MNPLPKPIVICGFAMMLMTAAVGADEVTSLKNRVAELEAQLVERDALIARLESELAALRGDKAEVVKRQEQLDRREAQLEELAGAVATGELTDRYATNVKVNHDKKKERTTVTAGPVLFEGEQLIGDFFVSAVYSVPGDNAAQTPDSVSLFLQTKFSGNLFEKTPELTFDVAGEPLVLPVADYEKTRKRSGLPGKNVRNKSDETVTFVIDVATLRRLAEAPALSMQTPDTPLTFSREQRALFRALLLRMEGDGLTQD